MEKTHKGRQPSNSSLDYNPFDLPENYYGPRTNPAAVPKNSRLGRVRTLSLVETNSLRHLKGFSDDEDESAAGESSDGYEEHDPNEAPTQFKNVFPFRQPFAENSHSLGDLSERSSDTGSGTASPETASTVDFSYDEKRPSILPIYGDLSNESLNDQSAPKADKEVQKSVERHLKKYKQIKQKFHRYRRASADDSYFTEPKKFFISDIDLTLKELLENEDTDHNCQITIEDTGPKVLKLGTANSNGYKQHDIRGTYMLSNLLQELTIAKKFGRKQMILDEARLNENPVDRLNRLITTQFWKALTRQVSDKNIAEMARDSKIQEEVIDPKTGEILKSQVSHRLYIPYDREDQYKYYIHLRDSNPDVNLDVQYLPKVIDGEFVKSINKKPGLLALASKHDPADPTKLISQPYVVPGGRFNELYGWDSYMETVGLLVSATSQANAEYLRLSRGMAENHIFEIDHYGKILNANRSYYLGRSQPPFLTDMSLRIYNKTIELYEGDADVEEDAKNFLARATRSAIKEYETIWCHEPRLDKESGLSCYHPEGKGIPPETEATHFDSILEPYAQKYKVTKPEFIEMYNNELVSEPDLDIYFLHDRAVRESGHDTSYRLEGKAAYLATVDLNSLLYKYETDIASALEKHFLNDDKYKELFANESVAKWTKRAEDRKHNITKYMWNEEEGIFYDYDVKKRKMTNYESATTFWPMWSKVASKEQAAKLVNQSVSKFEEYGGLVSGTLKSRGPIGLDRPSRQWDFPYGWAPQQILAWIGFQNYGYEGVTRRLSYRWLYLMTQAFVDFNGVVVEKYDVTQRIAPHKVTAEYGNQGSDFKGVATEGFGWVNASYIFGLTFANLHAKRCLGTLTDPEVFLKHLNSEQARLYDDRLTE
ncbi:cytosolic neutral trehalase [[Candida] railenensis]|uniref:Trehalase n=1 Tax=[Candida] railenensis TaxID=45579 RepID=A0A9P0QP51_9ASCO|nr:cytosolic neutral trehalase [[Candida] railenensis]